MKMEMSCTPSIKCSTFMSTLVVLMLLTQPGRGGVLYSCWGGCLNQCVLLADKKPQEKAPCYWDCLAKCFPVPSGKMAVDSSGIISDSSTVSEIPGSSVPNDPPKDGTSKHKYRHFNLGRKYYCIIGCSLQSCVNPRHAGIDLKICLIRCTHKCK